MFRITLVGIVSLLLISCTEEETEKDLDLQQVSFNKVQLEDNFWKPRLETQARVLVPHAFNRTQPAVENLSKTAKYLKGDTTDLPFPHRYISSDLYKVMEGAAYILANEYDAALSAKMDSIIDIIADAQQDDGYLYTAHITGVSRNHSHWDGGGMGDKPYSFVFHSHELYNMGHMYEAAVAYYLATGKDKWLKVAEKSAQHINKVIFEGDPNYNDGKPVNQAPGHQEMELALVKLYQVTGNDLYLDMSRKFLDIRGKTYIPDGEGVMSAKYAQQHLPIAEQREAVGHAVRATYMYCAMADVSSQLGIDDYSLALESIWNNIVNTRMHITGGLGALRHIEGFGPEYELPNKEAYCETCAAVGNVLFNYRMFLLEKDAKYMDVAEVALMNNVLVGINMEGNEFFYVNPLESDGHSPFNHGTAGRSPWFSTACCPSNIARLIPQVPGLMYSHTDEDIYLTLYASSKTDIPLKSGDVELVQSTDYPFSEKIDLILNPQQSQEFGLKLRIPTWAQGKQFVPGNLYFYQHPEEANSYQVSINGEPIQSALDHGFISLRREWNPGDKVELVLNMDVQYNVANENIKADVGRVAITRGPFVYCVESMDEEHPPQQLFFHHSHAASPEFTTRKIEDGILQNIITIGTPAQRINGESVQDEQVEMIPYYAWNNRGIHPMMVWFPTGHQAHEQGGQEN